MASLTFSRSLSDRFHRLPTAPWLSCRRPAGCSADLRWCVAAVPAGGPACGVAGERDTVPATLAADISALFIKSMTTLSSPISGPSCTGVLLLLSGRVSSILLPCYSLELLMANTIPPSFCPASPASQSLESGVARRELADRSEWGRKRSRRRRTFPESAFS